MPNTSGSVDLSTLSDEERQAVDDLAQEKGGPAPEEAEPDRVLTAFLVVVDLDFNPTPLAFQDPRFNLLTSATPDLIYGACSVLLKDLAATEDAQATASVMQQQAMALQQQMQDQMLAAQVGRNPKGMRA